MSEQTVANLCLVWMCCGWPLALFVVGFGMGRYGARGVVLNVLNALTRVLPSPKPKVEG